MPMKDVAPIPPKPWTPPAFVPDSLRQSWDRQDGESLKAFKAFCCYRDMGPGRTQIGAYELFTGKRPERGTVPGYHRIWIYRFDWKNRALAYDLYIKARDEEIQADVQRKSAEEWHQRSLLILTREWDYSERLFEMAENMLKLPIVEQVISKDGKTITYKPVRWTMAHVVSILQLASDLGRRATGQATEHKQLDIRALVLQLAPDLSKEQQDAVIADAERMMLLNVGSQE